jgi:DNA-binding response OmpR family regulator
MALTRRLKTSVFRCPPVLLLIARPQDRWLATWSEADSVASYPIDPRELQESLSSLLRARLS